jgi:glycosyl transferase family 87
MGSRVRPRLSLDAAVVGALALGNWLLLFQNHTIVQIDHDGPLWQLFPGLWGAAWMLACGLVAATYPLRDAGMGERFTRRDRVLHLAAIVAVFVVVPTVAAIVLRATGKPYTYVHDGAIMVEEAARKLLSGQDPYAVDYLDTPLFYWPMSNNPALYHFDYFPLLFLITAPFVKLFDALHLFFDERYLYLPAFIATLVVLPLMLPSTGDRARDFAYRISLVAFVALDPQLFPFVAEGRNDFFVLVFLTAGIALLTRERRTLGVLLIAVAASAKLHAGLFLPFVVAYLLWRDRGLPWRQVARRLVAATWAGAALMAVVFVPFVAWAPRAFWDDIVSYNAGGAPWSYPISGMGFSALLRAVGVISYPQADFAFWIFELAAAIPLGVWALRRLRRDPSIAELLLGSSVTLLAFLFFARYFQGNYLGYVLAVAAPVPFLRPELAASVVEAARRVIGRSRVATAMPEVATGVIVEGAVAEGD